MPVFFNAGKYLYDKEMAPDYPPKPHNKVLPAGIYELQFTDQTPKQLGDHGWWSPDCMFLYKPVEPSNDKILATERLGSITNEIKAFLEQKEQYKKFGFSHKRCFLLHGPPGCGKSSAIRFIEQQFVKEFNGVVLITNDNPRPWFAMIRRYEPQRPVMIIYEDIEQNLDDLEEQLLEFLDGQEGLNSFVMVATTNNLQSIPDRLKYRPSRIDRLIELTWPDMQTRFEYVSKILPDQVKAKNIAIATDGLSLADLKEIIIGTEILGKSIKDCVLGLKKAIKSE